jgi:hypothetical protein
LIWLLSVVFSELSIALWFGTAIADKSGKTSSGGFGGLSLTALFIGLTANVLTFESLLEVISDREDASLASRLALFWLRIPPALRYSTDFILSFVLAFVLYLLAGAAVLLVFGSKYLLPA